MADANGLLIYDLARAGVDEALDAIKRKALLMPDLRSKPMVVLVAAALLEAKAHALREGLAMFASDELNRELAGIVTDLAAKEKAAQDAKVTDFVTTRLEEAIRGASGAAQK